jgi:chromosome segregation ATPase
MHELVATQKQLEAAQEELAWVRASEKSYEKAVADWKSLATDLRQQVEATAVRERSAAEGYQRAANGWKEAVDSLRQQVRERDDEVGRLRHALSQAAKQGQGSEKSQLVIARLKRRIAREYLPFLDVTGVLTCPRPR